MPIASSVRLRVADEAWVALAKLHRSQPGRGSFSAKEIQQQVSADANGPVRPGITPHIYHHNVANVAPSSARYRMFYKLADGTFRLYRPTDDCHPNRKGKTCPRRSDLPKELHELLVWYENEYCSSGSAPSIDDDPVLQMLGVGKEIWAEEGGDAFIARERSGWDEVTDW